MSNDRVPAIRPQTHLVFRADTRILDEGSPPLACILCGALDADCGCERCRAPVHADCYLGRGMSAAERAIFLAAVAERTAAGAPQLTDVILERLTRLAEALGVPLRDVLLLAFQPEDPSPAEQAVAELVYLCPGCRS
jgi:hypothetical protein